MKTFLFSCLVLFCSNVTASEGWMFDFFTGEEESSLSSDLFWLKSYRSSKNNRWFYTYLKLNSGQGSNLYSYIRTRIPFITGNSSRFGLCSTNNNIYPVCSKDSIFKANIKTPTLVNDLPGPFSLWIPYIDLKETETEGGILLSKGGALPVDGVEDMVAVYNGNTPSDLDSASLKIYKIAHLIGLSTASDNIRNQIAPYTKCSNGISSFTCQKTDVGFFSVTGLLLRDMAIDCSDCNSKGKLILNYYAASYLLRSVNDRSLVRAGYKLLSSYEEHFDKIGLGSEVLKKIYRQVLST